MDDFLLVLIFSLFGGFFGYVIGKGDGMRPYQEMQDQCEATLPRDQHCIMQFVPQQKD